MKALKLELNTLRNCESDYVVKCYGAYSDVRNKEEKIERIWVWGEGLTYS